MDRPRVITRREISQKEKRKYHAFTYLWNPKYGSVQFSRSVVSDSLRPPWTAAHKASLSINNSWSLLKLTFMESVMPSNHLILCHTPLLPLSIFPSIRVFSHESVLGIKWPKYWRLSFSSIRFFQG